MKIKKKEVGGYLVISLGGDMEPYDAENFENEVLRIIEKGKTNIIIDFKGLGYISSSGLRALLNIRSRLEKEGGRLVLSSLTDKILDVFRVSKLLNIFEVVRDAQDVIGKP